MKAATADRLYKFADATVFFAHCQHQLDLLSHPHAMMRPHQLDAALQDLENAYQNLKTAKEMLLSAMEKETLEP